MKKPVAFALLILCVALLALSALAALAAEAVPGAPVSASPVPGADLVAVLLSYLPASWGGWVTLVVSVCAAVSAFWGRPSDNAPLPVRLLYAVVNAVGFNVKKAGNADDAGKALRMGGGGV